MGFCPHCGAALTEGARFCSACGRSLATGPSASPPAYVTPAAGAARPRVSEGMAIAALLLNLLTIPGIGSAIAGAKHGVPQLLVALGAAVGFVSGVLAIMTVAFSSDPSPIFLGIVIFTLSGIAWVGAWIWALITSIQLFNGSAPMRGDPA